jgi:uncharacterized membrane protein
VVIDIDRDSDLKQAYGDDIPVVEVGPYRLNAPFDRRKLRVTLGAAKDRQKQLLDVDDSTYKERIRRGGEISRTDRLSHWIARNYIHVFNLFLLLYVGIPFLAPVFQRAGATTPANIIYRVYGGLCHQLAYRSWFLYGEQPVYPREAAGLDGLLTFEEATGISEDDSSAARWAARSYIGNEGTGYKVAYCQRDVAIYGSMLVFGVLFALTGRRMKSLPFALWILVGLMPIGVDGVTQLLSNFMADPQFDFIGAYINFLPYRESTPFLRTLTGFLFGFTTAWFGFPLIEETMADARRILKTKYAHVASQSKVVEN